MTDDDLVTLLKNTFMSKVDEETYHTAVTEADVVMSGVAPDGASTGGDAAGGTAE